MDVGNQLRHARQQAGLSREDIAQTTKIQLAKVEALESNAFDRLPDGIYLDGLVKAYARAVGLDADDLVKQVHVARDDVPQEVAEEATVMTAAEAPHLPPAADPVRPAELEYITADPAYDRLDSEVDLLDRRAAVSHDMGPIGASPVLGGDERFSRDMLTGAHAGPAGAHGARRSSIPFVLAILVLLGASAWGGYMYESSRRAQSAHAAGAAPGARSAPEESGAAGDARTSAGAVVPSGQSPAVSEVERSAAGPSESADPLAVDLPGAGSGVSSTPEAPAAPASPAPPAGERVPAAPGPAAPELRAAAPADSPAAPVPSTSSDPSASPADLSGVWSLDTRVESSSYRDYEGLQLGYRLELQQDGSRVTGTGIKTVENGRQLGGRSQTPILVQGTIDGERLTLTFTERGIERTTDGRMILEVYDDGVLRGRFASSAARSSGTAEARRPGG